MASTPLRRSSSRALLTASAVALDVAPATIGTRPSVTSMVTSTTRSHSSLLSVGVSPVVPQGTRKPIPETTCHSTNSRRRFSSKLWSALNGVIKAVPHPLRFIILRITNHHGDRVPLPIAHQQFQETRKNPSVRESTRRRGLRLQQSPAGTWHRGSSGSCHSQNPTPPGACQRCRLRVEKQSQLFARCCLREFFGWWLPFRKACLSFERDVFLRYSHGSPCSWPERRRE